MFIIGMVGVARGKPAPPLLYNDYCRDGGRGQGGTCSAPCYTMFRICANRNIANILYIREVVPSVVYTFVYLALYSIIKFFYLRMSVETM